MKEERRFGRRTSKRLCLEGPVQVGPTQEQPCLQLGEDSPVLPKPGEFLFYVNDQPLLILLRSSLAVTKLQVSKSKRSITLVENRPIPLNCSVKSQTSPDSHFAVLWYVHKPSDADGKLILKTTHSSAFEYGTYAEEEGLRGRLQFERSASGGLFSLTVQRAEVRDSGSYYCHVEEWLLSPNHAWYKLAEEVSGRTEVTVKQPGTTCRAGGVLLASALVHGSQAHRAFLGQQGSSALLSAAALSLPPCILMPACPCMKRDVFLL